MKIINEDVTIKIGNIVKNHKNMILNSYLDLFANNFLQFKNKTLTSCLIKLDEADNININSTTMNYDISLELDVNTDEENIYNENFIINKYVYYNAETETPGFKNFIGRKIAAIGFGIYDYSIKNYIIYAYLDVSNDNIYISEGQDIRISRTDKIETEMIFYSNFKDISYPIHLSNKGLLESLGMEYIIYIPRLYSVGLGVLPNLIEDEYLINNLSTQKIDTGRITIESTESTEIIIEDKGNGIYSNANLYPGSEVFPISATQKYIIYKFKIYQEVYNQETEQNDYIDTGKYYLMSVKTDITNKIKSIIKYERG